MADGAELLQCYREALAIGQELLVALAHPTSGTEPVDRLVDLLARRQRLLEECQSFVSMMGQGDEAVLGAIQQLVKQQQQLEKAWAASLQRMRKASAQSWQSREALQGVRRMLGTGSRSRLMDQRR